MRFCIQNWFEFQLPRGLKNQTLSLPPPPPPEGTYNFQIVGNEILIIADYKYAKNFSYIAILDVKLWLKVTKFCINFEPSIQWMLSSIKDDLCLSHHLLSQQNYKCLHIFNRQCTKFDISNVWSRCSLGRGPRFFVHWNLAFKQILITKSQSLLCESFKMLFEWEKSNTYIVKWLQRFLNLVHRFLKRTLVASAVFIITSVLQKFGPWISAEWDIQSLKLIFYRKKSWSWKGGKWFIHFVPKALSYYTIKIFCIFDFWLP